MGNPAVTSVNGMWKNSKAAPDVLTAVAPVSAVESYTGDIIVQMCAEVTLAGGAGSTAGDITFQKLAFKVGSTGVVKVGFSVAGGVVTPAISSTEGENTITAATIRGSGAAAGSIATADIKFTVCVTVPAAAAVTSDWFSTAKSLSLTATFGLTEDASPAKLLVSPPTYDAK